MKNYKQFNQDINENVKGWLGKAWNFTRPLKTLDRIDNVNVIRNKNANPIDKAAAAYGVIKPFSLPSYGHDVFRQGKTDSLLDKGLNQIAKTTTNVTGGRLTPNNPKTDIGAKLSRKIFSPLKTIFQKRKTNAGANDLRRQNNMG